MSIVKVVMLSGGVTSFEALLRTLKATPAREVVALFADTLTEDDDLYRFLDDISRLVHPVTRISDGRDIWQLFRDRRFIGNTRVDVCSQVLKRDLCRKWLKSNAPNTVLVLGFDWTEPHRIERSRARWGADGFDTEFPLARKPYLMKSEYMENARSIGIEPPRLYRYGFEHNNCGGACVKGGQGQWARLLATFPERYAWHERQEEITRQVINSDVAILRDRTNGDTRPLTLREFRERIEAGIKPQDNLFSCSCMG